MMTKQWKSCYIVPTPILFYYCQCQVPLSFEESMNFCSSRTVVDLVVNVIIHDRLLHADMHPMTYVTVRVDTLTQ